MFFIGKLTNTEIDLIKLAYDHEFKVFNKGCGFLSIDCNTTAQSDILRKGKVFLKKKAGLLKNFLLNKPLKPQNRQSEKLEIINFFSQEHQDYFRNVCQELNPEAIIVEYIRLAYLVKGFDKIGTQPLTLIDTHDVAYQRYQRFRDNGESEIKITAQEEKQLLSFFDVILAIQNKDKETFKKMLPEHHVIQVGHPSQPQKHEFLNKSPINITYVAGPNSSNKRAIAHFLKKVWVKLIEKFKYKIKLHIVGRICEELTDVEIPANVQLIGWTNDLENVYKEADIVINPVYFGTGLKIKNVEALCHSKPLVTTTVGAEGLEHGINNAFLVSDRPEETFKQISTLIENEEIRKDFSDKAYAFACQNLAEDKVYRELCQVLNKST
ncbi:glycosyltransferase family 4 protein [Gloeocapsopsis crepidinum LEGE 06123]|uniref:Glycosyltransferase family 4 protein n=1 Tax=Gloeocapsopsis crepidinum LEGE 06123 TaxID=588587 RepID=A0ABR9UZB3_9CHRO|nr:glycosyltransferase [Gloeocapsopsis crepidinum]MBE9193629.1 glycosyltransferase family 4 protein [Gloeocapsopsis crepidinum LEGE 06123]